MKLHDAIKEIINQFGNDIIVQPQFVNLIDDFQGFADIPSAKVFLKEACRQRDLFKVRDLYFKSKNISEQQIRQELLRISHITANKFAIKQDIAEYCYESMAFGLSIINNVNDITLSRKEISTNIVGHWDFYYRNGKKLQLVIKPDGTAITSLGNKYLWKAFSVDEILIYIEGMVSYRGIINDDRIDGQAYSEQFGNCWPWYATRRDDGLTLDNLTNGAWVIVNEHDDLEDNEIEFFKNGVLNSSSYEKGKWELNGGALKIEMADGFLIYEAGFSKGMIAGEARNLVGDNWKFKLNKKQ